MEPSAAIAKPESRGRQLGRLGKQLFFDHSLHRECEILKQTGPRENGFFILSTTKILTATRNPSIAEGLVEFSLQPDLGEIPVALSGVSRDPENFRRFVDRHSYEIA